MPDKNTQNEERAFDSELERVKQIVEQLEQGSVSLENGARLFTEACEKLKFCRGRLDSIRNEIEQLNGEIQQDKDFLDGAK